MNRALALSRPCGASDTISLLLAALQHMCLADVVTLRSHMCLADAVTLRSLCRCSPAWIPALDWGTPLRLLFAFPCEEGIALLRRCTLSGCLRPQSVTHLAGLLITALRELAFFPRCQEASLLHVLFRYCIALFPWQVQTPLVRAAVGIGGLRWDDWQLARARKGRFFALWGYKQIESSGEKLQRGVAETLRRFKC